MKKSVKYVIILAFIVVLAVGFYYLFCTVRTPEITGIVIDKETKTPIENAWIMATVETDTRTFGGDVSIHYLITRPHTRTDTEGRFTIPSHVYYSSPPPLGWGITMTRLRVDVYAPGTKRGAIDLYTYKQVGQPVPQDKEAIITPEPSLKERSLAVTIPVTHVAMSIEQTKEDLAKPAGYCGSGRYRFSWPVIPEACGSIELDYIIEGYEKLRSQLTDKRTIDGSIDYVNTLSTLALSYKRKGAYKEAFDMYTAICNFQKEKGWKAELAECKVEIGKLKEKLKEK